MITVPAFALTLTLSLGATDPLAAAQEAFSSGDYESAERLALEAAQASAPSNGTAMYLAGLARFRAGHPEAALEALNAAGVAPDAPARAVWQFNRAACLYELGRFKEAEQAYIEAAADPDLARVAYANAGFAALDAGAPDRARALAERAAKDATGAERALVDDLLAQLDAPEAPSAPDAYQEALAAFDDGRYAEARAAFVALSEQDAASGRARLMAGAAAWKLGQMQQAERDVRASLQLPLTAFERDVAQQYLDRLSFGLRAAPEGANAWASVSAGVDTNPLQVGIAQRDIMMGPRAPRLTSPFSDLSLAASYRLKLGDAWAATASYTGEQRAYVTWLAQDYSVQLHRLTLRAERTFFSGLRLGASFGGDTSFTGLSAFRGLQASAFGSAFAAWDESAATSSRVEVALSRKLGLTDEFSYLTGTRVDVTASQQARLGQLTASAWYRYRSDGAGTLVVDGAFVSTELGCVGCTYAYVVPFSYRSHAVGLTARAPLGSRFEADVEAAVENRLDTAQNYLRATRPDGLTEQWNVRTRDDLRVTLSPALSLRLWPGLTLTAQYDLVVNRSNIDTRLPDEPGACLTQDRGCHALDYANENYLKHVFMFELGGRW